jgi:hypothetical protein
VLVLLPKKIFFSVHNISFLFFCFSAFHSFVLFLFYIFVFVSFPSLSLLFPSHNPLLFSSHTHTHYRKENLYLTLSATCQLCFSLSPHALVLKNSSIFQFSPPSLAFVFSLLPFHIYFCYFIHITLRSTTPFFKPNHSNVCLLLVKKLLLA